ncbi:MAG: type V CRISPR-associated protein Cas4 [Treponema sp.]|nr:type V CRISPR-associated protein Cas4 [Treponema sp.]
MELYLKISYFNDFIFCPLSIYYHQLYGDLSERLYYGSAQLDGKAVHSAVDEKRYSTHKNILQSLDIYSDEYNLCGKIDIFDTEKGLLTERKKHIETIYNGYIFQLYAQTICLREMGYTVKQIRFYSSDDNKVYPVLLPEEDPVMFNKFKETNEAMQKFDVSSYKPQTTEKCRNCIYNDFCDRPLAPKAYHGGF